MSVNRENTDQLKLELKLKNLVIWVWVTVEGTLQNLRNFKVASKRSANAIKQTRNINNAFLKEFKPKKREEILIYYLKFYKATLGARPVVSAVNTITYYASRFLHNLLYPYVEKLPTICFSSQSLLPILNKSFSLKSDSVILCADVTSLYPSIRHDFGISVVEQVLIDFGGVMMYVIPTTGPLVFEYESLDFVSIDVKKQMELKLEKVETQYLVESGYLELMNLRIQSV
jgi:hypothetical protein